MKYVKFGNAGIEVSKLALGCMDFPTRLDESEAQRVLDTALDHGVNLLDTADTYEKGRAEEVLGRILKGKRDRVILATKFWAKMYDRPNGRGCSRVHIINALEDSLRRLQTDWIDLYQLHHPDSNTPVEETISTLDNLIKQGKIRYYGVSNHYAWQMAHMLGVSALHNWEPLISVQCRYNIIDRAIENEIVHFVQRFNIATMIYGGLSGGILSGDYHRGDQPIPGSRLARLKNYQAKITDATFDLLEKLEVLCKKYNIGMNQLAIAWLVSKPYVTTVLMGGSKPEHFEPIYNVLDLEIAPEDLQQIDEWSQQWRFIPFHNQRIVEGAAPALNWW
ncbi:MAG: aldo/keto reductase [Armatimonadetes bacterium]|nr:aldo/keto reductase [Armatimonadota bacterium]